MKSSSATIHPSAYTESHRRHSAFGKKHNGLMEKNKSSDQDASC